MSRTETFNWRRTSLRILFFAAIRQCGKGVDSFALAGNCAASGFIRDDCRVPLQANSEAYRFAQGVPEGLDIVNVGSTPGVYDISYAHSPWKGYNFSMAPQSFKYAFRLLERFKCYINIGAIIIIIIICPLNFGNNRDYKRRNYSDKYYGILPPEMIDRYSAVRALLLRRPLLMKSIGWIARHAGCLLHGEERRATQKSDEPEIVRAWKRECGVRDLQDASQADDQRQAFLEKQEIVHNGLDFCERMGWKPVFVIPPVPPSTRKYVSDAFCQRFVYDNLQAIVADRPNVPILDYWRDERYDEAMFQNDLVMNVQGRENFSAQLFEDIQRTFGEGTRKHG